ncbi:tRNA (adenosine(37)-N6)-threonylcarbamoyltransferase complex dimerization subunit type 1 TsaB [Jannaschia marina]|uniref:tRNA (adenosine(37)-N6)-threonylcarbamoyltransferase complex dimerization subunit type 1 TsaB n=1 Tax=Jannaschia marina TaxID=2741674 RepID=UPI0015C88716|nr:tRNA (adenosine(37)-N6)-threonylcarbamoyltransferase complex dimerization subunit type 1 TsaB [Jannaschia marina]
MTDAPRILGFDTSGPWLGTAVFRDGDVVAAHHLDLAKGQAERLMPTILETLDEAGLAPADLHAIGVGTGPGNFTGTRISVAAARGLALGLGVPAIGVSLFDALALDAPRPVLALLTAPRDRLYLQRYGTAGPEGAAEMIERTALGDQLRPGDTLVGHDSQALAAQLGARHVPAAFAPASAIARIAVERLGTDGPRPAPIYLRPADAATASDPPPRILP